jgi:glutamate--cysteine ligase
MMVSHSDLRRFLDRGVRQPGQGKLGLEFEQFVISAEGGIVQYLGPNGVEELMQFLSQKTGWKEKREGDHLMALIAEDGRALTLEPGAQLEFGSTPVADLPSMDQEVQHYCNLLAQANEHFGHSFLAVGSHPTASPEDLVRLPKRRYDVLDPWLREAGTLGIWMMRTTAGVQINFDYFSEPDAMAKLRLVYRLAPVFNAIFANSPLRAGKLSGYMSWRGHIWTDTDEVRCGMIERFLHPDLSFEDYVDWVLDVPMLFIEREGEQVDMRGHSFRDWMAQGKATYEDWELHLSTPFPEVRFRPQVELRTADTVPPSYALALAAFVEGLFYNEEAQAQATALVEDWSVAEIMQAWHDAHRHALAAPSPKGGKLLDVARELLQIAKPSASAMPYLEPLRELLEDGRSLAERKVAAFEAAGGITTNSLQEVLGSGCCAGYSPSV